MKKFLYLLMPVLLLGHANQAEARPSSPWFPEGAEWYYGIANNDISSATGCIHMTVAKDTLFAGRQCKQLRLEACDGAYETLYEYVYPCGDSLFYYNYAAEDFFLLLDLSARKGDTVWVHDSVFTPNPGFDPYSNINSYANSCMFMAYRITAIDSVLIAGKSLRRQKAEAIVWRRNGDQYGESTYWELPNYSDGNDYIMEGFGSLGGFWGGPRSWPRGPFFLRCFFAENKTYLTDGKCDNVAVETPLDNPASFWRLSPQPAAESVRAVCESTADEAWHSGRWRLVDAAGKALQGGVFTDGNFEIGLEAYPTGLYFVEITAADGTNCRLKCLKATR